jgi:DNA-binding transcriptional MerR regulator
MNETNDYTQFVSHLLRRLTKMNYIKPGELPNINLYMDQVTTFMDEHLSDCKRRENDKILTKTMINNYTKNNLLPPPEKKKYSKEHLYLLTFIYYFKNILSISDIQTILEPLTKHFFSESETSLDDIYKCVYELCKSQIAGISQDVLDKAKLAADSYEDIQESSDKDFLQLFSLVSMLSFDVYMKKNIIENLIDDFASRTQPAQPESKKSKKKE